MPTLQAGRAGPGNRRPTTGCGTPSAASTAGCGTETGARSGSGHSDRESATPSACGTETGGGVTDCSHATRI
jgi:hypothetical protein